MRICAGLLLVFMFFLGILYWYLQKNPVELANKYLADISARTGLQFSFGAVDVTLLPLPAIAISDLAIKGDKLDFTVSWLLMRPAYMQILRGNFSPGQIILLRPRLNATTDLPLSRPGDCLRLVTRHLDKAGGEDAFIDNLSCDVDIAQGEAVIKGRDNSRLLFKSLQTRMAVESGLRLDGQFNLAAVRLEEDNECLAAIENLTITGKGSPAYILTDSRNLKIGGHMFIKDVASDIHVQLELNGSKAAWNSSLSLAGDLDLAGTAVPVSLSGRASRVAQSQRIRLRGFAWQLDCDSGRFDGSLRLPEHKDGFALAGELQAHRLSLTQWLGFARNLAPGLQLALDNIVNARLRFRITPKGLQVSEIEAECLGSVFTGHGSVAEWAKPVVALDLKSAKANLGLAVPESLGISPLAPSFPYPPLTPMPGKPLEPGETGIGYDVRLAAAKLVYGPLLLENASLRIYPGKMDKTGLEDVLLDGKASFYGGNVTGSCILGADKSLPISITATARQVNGAPLGKAMPLLPLRQGRYYGDVKVMSRGKKLNMFLANLRGQISVSGDKAALPGLDGIFTRLEAAVALEGANFDGKRAGFTGKWRGMLKNSDYEARGELNGRLLFGAHGVSFSDLPAEGSLLAIKEFGPLPEGTKATLKGRARCDSGNLEVEKFKLAVVGINASGNASITGGGKFSGKFQTENVNIEQTLAKLGIGGVQVPSAMRTATLAADFNGNQKQIKLGKIRARAGQLAVSGSLSCHKRNDKPFFEFSLTAEKADLENLTAGKKSSPKNGKWDFGFLKKFAATGELRVNELLAWGVKVSSLKMPMRLDGGRLTLGPNTATFYGAPMQSRGSMDFNRGVAFKSIFAVHDFDLGALAKDRKINGVLKGRGNLDARLEATMTGPGQMPGVLGGDFSFSMRNGSWQSSKKDGSADGKPTVFTRAQASGKIEKGVLRSNDFAMTGPGMEVSGGGWLNLGTKQIECSLNVNMKGLPDFPLRVYGPLGQTKTSIGAGKMVLNAIGGITTGFIDILGGIAEGALKIFR